MTPELEPLHIVRASSARACCAKLQRIRLYRRTEGRREVVFALICPEHGVDGRGAAPKAPARACGIRAFKQRPLPGRP